MFRLALAAILFVLGGILSLTAAEAQGAPDFAAPKPPAVINDWSRDEFQFRFTLSNRGAAGNKTSSEATVYLYIPEHTRKIRALFLLQQNVSEQMIAVHPAIRKVCNADDVAVAWCQTGFDVNFDLAGARQTHDMLQEEFGRFGRTIGYPELGEVPLITYGHSATDAYCQNAAEGEPDRVLAVIITHGWNGVQSFKNYRGPVLLFIGPVWEMGQQGKGMGNPRGMNSIGKARKKLAENWMPISIIDQFGSGHFDYADEVVEFFAMYIDKAMKARLDANGNLRDVDPDFGYICPNMPAAPAAPLAIKPYSEGSAQEKAGSIWFFDKELAEAAARIICGNGPWNRAAQMIAYNNPDGTPAPFGKSGLVNPAPYRIVPGTNEIQIFPVLLDAFPAGFKEEGQPLARSANAAITIEYDNGPYVYLEKDGKYHVKANRGTDAGYIVARNRADAKTRPAVQPTYLRLGGRGAGGGSVSIEKCADQKAGAVIPLKNASTADTFVGYYVDHGPARVVGDKLMILPLPANTPGPVKVELVAYSLQQTITGRSSVKFNVTK